MGTDTPNAAMLHISFILVFGIPSLSFTSHHPHSPLCRCRPQHTGSSERPKKGDQKPPSLSVVFLFLYCLEETTPSFTTYFVVRIARKWEEFFSCFLNTKNPFRSIPDMYGKNGNFTLRLFEYAKNEQPT